MHQRQRPTVLYTDASDVPAREPRYGLGAVIIQQEPTFIIQYFSCSPETTLVESWQQRSTYMAQLELLVCPTALMTWRELLSHRTLIHFIDNDSAACGLVRGFSPKNDSSAIIGEYWSIAAANCIDPYIDRVESKSNLSDEPSRFSFTLMSSLNAARVRPIFPKPTVSPIFSFFGESAALLSVTPQFTLGKASWAPSRCEWLAVVLASQLITLSGSRVQPLLV